MGRLRTGGEGGKFKSMKQKSFLKGLAFVVLFGVIGHLVCGCANLKDKQVLEKSTVFGFQAKTPGGTAYETVIQIGLVRNEYWSNPTSTNKVYVGAYSSRVDAKLSALSQTAKEDFSTLPQAIKEQDGTNSNSIITGPQ